MSPPSRDPDGDRHLSYSHPSCAAPAGGQSEPKPDQNSPCKFILYLPACPMPQGPQHVSQLHYIIDPFHAFSSISLSPAKLSSRYFLQHLPSSPNSTHPYSPFSSRTLQDTPPLSSCSIFQPSSFPLPVIPVDFESSSTLNKNNPNLPISNTSHPLPA